MLCMHLDTPREMFTYLENRYGQIPRLEIQKTVDEAVQQHDMPSEQYMTGESAQSTCNSDNEPENSPGGHEDPVDSPNDCAETKSGFLTPKTKVTDVRHVEPHLLVVETQTGHRKPKNEVVDMRQVVDVLPMFEVGSTGQAWYNKHVKELKASDKGSQCASDEVVESRDLPEMSCKALDPVDSIVGQTSGRPTEHVPQMPIEENQHAQTHSETIANVPDPPWTHTKLPTPHIESSTLQSRPLA
ncbi:hypothetical protein EDD17DRAFT_1828282 [Pisolithus thermaeus]|nr:hypothetical protein EDD17DRAFT_1828282 [Pisolithus thermaeus]